MAGDRTDQDRFLESLEDRGPAVRPISRLGYVCRCFEFHDLAAEFLKGECRHDEPLPVASVLIWGARGRAQPAEKITVSFAESGQSGLAPMVIQSGRSQ